MDEKDNGFQETLKRQWRRMGAEEDLERRIDILIGLLEYIKGNRQLWLQDHHVVIRKDIRRIYNRAVKLASEEKKIQLSEYKDLMSNITYVDKSSVSPSIVIIFNNRGSIPKYPIGRGVVMKLWISSTQRAPFNTENVIERYQSMGRDRFLDSENNLRTQLDYQHQEFGKYIDALDYETKIYKSTIRRIMKADKNNPFLRYVGSAETTTPSEIYRLINGDDDSDVLEFYCTLAQYLQSGRDSYEYSKLGQMKHRKSNLPLIEQVNFSCVLLPQQSIACFDNLIKTPDTQAVIMSLAKICDGIKQMYDNRLTHNDLHAGNILVSGNQVKIYDFDRAYLDGDPNPSLSSDCKEGVCGLGSACNIYHPNYYCIDFYKIISYLCFSQHWPIVKRLFGIPNNEATDALFRRSMFDYFSLNLGGQPTTYLHCPQYSYSFARVVEQMGPYNVILSRFIANVNDEMRSGRMGFTKSERVFNLDLERIKPSSAKPSSAKPSSAKPKILSSKEIDKALKQIGNMKYTFPELPQRPISYYINKD
jgi:hypothetical protein